MVGIILNYILVCSEGVFVTIFMQGDSSLTAGLFA